MHHADSGHDSSSITPCFNSARHRTLSSPQTISPGQLSLLEAWGWLSRPRQPRRVLTVKFFGFFSAFVLTCVSHESNVKASGTHKIHNRHSIPCYRRVWMFWAKVL